ncbi:MAG TPA: DNA gyrase inhibitor YacG [Casimicrobiaceae bacterium]|nr:DNA gyrase inhibitor YacG [Casimicrobiaceae bacterium]
MAKPRTVACPQCGTPVEWTPESRWRPFCSQRCKMIDLGAWASESYRIPSERSDPDDVPSSDQDSDR